MAGVRAAKRYAKGLIQFANESNQAESINQEMKDIKMSIQGSRELAQFLSSPVLDAKRKNEIAKELFKGFSQTTQNFIHLIINQGRGSMLMEITSQFAELYNRQNNRNTSTLGITPLPYRKPCNNIASFIPSLRSKTFRSIEK